MPEKFGSNESQKPKNWFDLAGDEGAVGGRRGGGVGQGGGVGASKSPLVQFFGLPYKPNWQGGGEMGVGHQRAVWGGPGRPEKTGLRRPREQCGSNKVRTGSHLSSLKNVIGLIWLVTRGMGGEAWGGGGPGGEMGGAPESSVGATKGCTGSTFGQNLTIGLIWLVSFLKNR